MADTIPDIEPELGPGPDDDQNGLPLSAAQLTQLSQQLQAVYDQVPATCCAGSGECCALTDEEMVEGYATMFPLYLAEYVNIAEHIRSQPDEERRRALLGHTQERPRQCPFLGQDRGCTIYPVRPLICRTYAVLDPETIAAAATEHADDKPEDWIRGFVRREGAMHCPRVTLTQPERLAQHVQNLISYTYERALARLSRRIYDQLPEARRKGVRDQIRRRGWPTRWTWGGYNSLYMSSTQWIQDHLKRYWKRAELKDLD